MFGVIMSGDTRENVCVLQMRRLHEVNVKFIFFMMKRCRQCALMFGFCNPRRSLGETCASWGGVAPGLARRRCSNGDLS